MTFVRRLLYRLLGPRHYLKVLSSVFLRLYFSNLLKRRFPQHYFVTRLIRDGDTVLDIGANLGYYSVPLSKAVGPIGTVIAVEPVPLFADVLEANLRRHRCSNVALHRVALGSEDNATIRMVVPVVNNVLRHGLSTVVDGGTAQPDSFEVIQQDPAVLFGDLKRLDLVKCDVEGYEMQILPQMQEIFRRHSPLLQVEVSDENLAPMTELMALWGYEMFCLRSGALQRLRTGTERDSGDLYFLPAGQEDRWSEQIRGSIT